LFFELRRARKESRAIAKRQRDSAARACSGLQRRKARHQTSLGVCRIFAAQRLNPTGTYGCATGRFRPVAQPINGIPSQNTAL
jgi:hypothetical protein